MPHGVAHRDAPGLLGRSVGGGPSRLGRSRERGRGLRAGRDGLRSGAGGRGSPRMRRRRRDPPAADRRLVDARQRPDLRSRPGRRRGPRPLPLQLVGREVPPVRPGRGRAAAHRRAPGHASVRGAVRAGGRVVLRGRRGNADHHRAVPAEPESQPDVVEGADRGGTPRLPRGRDDRVARRRAVRRPGHRRARRRRRPVRRAGAGRAPVAGGSRRPRPRGREGQPRPAAGGRGTRAAASSR